VKILLLDDDRDAMEWVVDALTEYGGHTVERVYTVGEAEAKFADGKWGYELFIIDVQIPGLDPDTTEKESEEAGITLLEKFHRSFPRERVMILTNNLYRVPREVCDANTKAFDKVEVRGLRILDAIKDW
jgi:DNA-binding response OmpR family regulator